MTLPITTFPDLARLLLATGDAHIEEGNTWGDTVWGTCNGVGQNMLGRLLMQVREEIGADLPPIPEPGVRRYRG